MKLAIAFIVYSSSSYPYLQDFLTSLKKASAFLNNHELEILIGDNSVNDNRNKKFIQENSIINNKKIKYFEFGKNLGFAKAYNILIKQAKANDCSHFLMLNPDILIDEKAIENLVVAAKKHSEIVAFLPKILVWDFKKQKKTEIIDSYGISLSPGLRFKDYQQGEIDQGDYKKGKIIGPSGAAALFNMQYLEKLKEDQSYFDESFFMYKEDCDLAYRMYLNDLPIKLVTEAVLYHDRSASGGSFFDKLKKRRKRSKKERAWSFFGQHYLFIKHWSSQNILEKFLIIVYIKKLFIYSLLFEPFVLKQYRKLYKIIK